MGKRLFRSRLDQVTGVLLGVLVLAQVVWAVVGTFCLPDHINSRQALLNSVWGIGVCTAAREPLGKTSWFGPRGQHQSNPIFYRA